MSKRIALLSAAAFSLLAFSATMSAPASAEEKTVMVGGAAMFPSKNIIENAVNSKDHTTLVAAVKAAGLVKTLEGKGPFTVFAPTNAAFDKLPASTIDELKTNADMLKNILTFHVVQGQASPSKVNGTHKTLQGADVDVSGQGKGLKVNDAGLVCGGVHTANATVYTIDTVLTPPSQ